MCYYCGKHKRPHGAPNTFDHRLNTPCASHNSAWETQGHKYNIYFQADIAKETPDARCQADFSIKRKISMYPYPT